MVNLKQKNNYIFDMDGTLINLEKLNKESYSNTIKEYFNLDLNNEEYQKYFSGTRTAKAFSGFLDSMNIENYNTEDLIVHFRKQKRKNLLENFNDCVSLIPGTKEYLKKLKGEDKKLALATSTVKEFVDIIVDNLDIRQYFNTIVTAEDITEGKPNPEIFLLAQKQLKGNSNESIVFEDSKNGIEAALASGMECIGIHTVGLNDNWVNKADSVIKNYEELLD